MPPHRDAHALNRSVIEEFRANNGQVTNARLREIPLVLLVMLDGPLCTLECAQRAIGYERRAPCVQVCPANRAKRPSEGPADT
jgi:Fe-S-cluster-containing hydrogenase component 2